MRSIRCEVLLLSLLIAVPSVSAQEIPLQPGDHVVYIGNTLADRMQQIDLRDGVADGRITHTVAECPSCHRKTTRRRAECMYCGQPLEVDEETFGKD